MQLGIFSTCEGAGVLDDLVDRPSAARLLGVVPRTLDRWHLAQVGPPRIEMGRKVRYRRRALEQWVLSREARHGIGA